MMKIKSGKGITLIALIVTIIILLILAGITISQLSRSGLFENVKLAEQKSKESQEKEEGILSDYENKIGKYVSGTRESFTETELWTGEMSSTGIIQLKDSYKNYKSLVFVYGDALSKRDAITTNEKLVSTIDFAKENDLKISLFWYSDYSCKMTVIDNTTFDVNSQKSTTLYKIIGLK